MGKPTDNLLKWLFNAGGAGQSSPLVWFTQGLSSQAYNGNPITGWLMQLIGMMPSLASGGSGSGLFGRNAPSTSSIFAYKAGLSTSSGNPALLFNQLKGADGADFHVVTNTTTFSIAAANTQRITLMGDVGVSVAAATTGNDQIPVYLASEEVHHLVSSSPFSVVPFVVLMENGETISNADYNGSSIVTAAMSALPAQTRNIVFGPVGPSRQVIDSAGAKFIANLTIHRKALYNAMSIHLRKNAMTEHNPLVLQLGLIISGVASQTVSDSYQTFNVIKQTSPDLFREVA